MVIRLLQLNINADNYRNQLIAFLSQHDFDVIQLQELAGKGTRLGNINCSIDCFAQLQTLLGELYEGDMVIADTLSSNPQTSYFGNAIFYKKSFQKISTKDITLKKTTTAFNSDAKSYEELGRKAIHTTLAKEGKIISFINTHCAWAPTPIEQPHQQEQNNILINYVQQITPPCILSGDFNITPDQPSIIKLSSFMNNLTIQYGVTNTLNPRTHSAKQLFPPGIPVDYIFTSKDIITQQFEVTQEDISDHFGLTAILEI